MTVPADADADDCPAPRWCPVGSSAWVPEARTARLSADAPFWRCYDGTWGYDEFNPGYGDTRFAPLADDTGPPLPTIHAAGTREAALLDVVFHDVHQDAERLVYESDLRKLLLCQVLLPTPPVVVDLRDDALELLGLHRGQLVSGPAEHYPCTRRIARQLHRQHPNAEGLVWHSRQAELGGHGQVETLVLFGDRYGVERGSWSRIGSGRTSAASGHMIAVRDPFVQVSVAWGSQNRDFL